MTGRFAERVEQYVAMRRGLGYRLDRQTTYLRSFAAFLDRCGPDGPVPLSLSVQWATDTRSPDPHNPARRLSAVGGFLRYLAPLDGGTEIPPPGLLGPSHHRTPPHIYSDQEITSLLAAAAELSPRGGLRPECYVTLFALLASTGLRISEALALARQDVDLTEGLVTVRAGKAGKTRLVPLHPSALGPLGTYAAHRDRVTGSCEGAFFRTDHAEQLTYAAVRGTFKRLRNRLGWTSDGRTRRPRIHDLRHRMVVQRMLAWYAEGADVDAKLPALATYLGHAQISDVYWYFSVTPELMSIVGERFGNFGGQCSAGMR
jgi:integrase/recombinase XerD